MKRKTLFGIYGKVLSYTLLILLVVVIIAAAFFSGQIVAALENMERQQLTNIFAPLMEQLDKKTDEEVISISEDFHAKNTAFDFYILNENKEIIYMTHSFVPLSNDNAPNKSDDNAYYFGNGKDEKFEMSAPLPSGVKIFMSGTASGGTVYQEFIKKTIIVLLLLFTISGLSASFFAYRFTKPIKTIAKDTKRMSNLEVVPLPKTCSDEIGQLANDVYTMYEKLKAEIERGREMEESQRYFFSAASHELKTPIASTLILLQGMFDNIGEYKDHSKYLLECIKKMKTQSKIITQILEIVRLTDGTIIPNCEQININEVVQDVVASHQTFIESREQTLIVNISEKATCKADRVMLTRVISNVMLNAAQNTPEHGEICIWHEEENNTSVRLFILNKGAKIDMETLSNVFEPFYQGDKARSSEVERSGLGLAIVKKTLNCMGVPFLLENRDDGVCFCMVLPM